MNYLGYTEFSFILLSKFLAFIKFLYFLHSRNRQVAIQYIRKVFKRSEKSSEAAIFLVLKEKW